MTKSKYKIGGKWFDVYSFQPTKAKAQTKAKTIRKKWGTRVYCRVLRIKPFTLRSKTYRYAVLTRLKKR